MKRKLTPAFVQKPPLPEKGDRLIVWDTAVQGFGLVVQRWGKVSFCVQYRHRRRSRRMTIPGVLSLDEAGKRARRLLGQVANDHDALNEKRKAEASAANTLKSVCEELPWPREERRFSALYWAAAAHFRTPGLSEADCGPTDR